MSDKSAVTKVLVDAHIHMYECFDLQLLLESARQNFIQICEQQDLSVSKTAFCLLCVDLQDRDFEASLNRLSSLPDYTVAEISPDEPYSRQLVHKASGKTMQVVWGHQIVCLENLEVLVFGLTQTVPNGTPLIDVITKLSGAAFGILPWGFGKWTGKRKKHVAKLIADDQDNIQLQPWWVGDNGGRLSLAPKPRLIRQAGRRGRWDIPGSDPLPFPEQAKRAGTCGVILECHYDMNKPMKSIRSGLLQVTSQPTTFGVGEPIMRFLIAQIRMQLRKRNRL